MDNKYKDCEQYIDGFTVEQLYEKEYSDMVAGKKAEERQRKVENDRKARDKYEGQTETVMLIMLGGGFFIGIVIYILIIMASGFYGVVFGWMLAALPPIGLLGIYKIYEFARSKEKKLKQQYKEIELEESQALTRLSQEAAKNAQMAIDAYHNNVRQLTDKLLANPSNVEKMVEYSVDMFKRMISHADSGSKNKFIECNFTYVVTATEIKYLYDSEYTNPKDDFNFEVQRYRILQYNYEYEALALALSRLITDRMISLYPANTVQINVTNRNAKVSMSFKAPNDNFVVSTSIF